jgi:hypothetical protein
VGQTFLHKGLATARWLLGEFFATKHGDEVVEGRTITLRTSSEQQQDVVIAPKLCEKRGEQQIPTTVVQSLCSGDICTFKFVQER